MKIFLSLELVGMLLILWGIWFDCSHWENIFYSNGGWTMNYTIKRHIRAWARFAMTVGATLIIGGPFFIIWSS